MSRISGAFGVRSESGEIDRIRHHGISSGGLESCLTRSSLTLSETAMIEPARGNTCRMKARMRRRSQGPKWARLSGRLVNIDHDAQSRRKQKLGQQGDRV